MDKRSVFYCVWRIKGQLNQGCMHTFSKHNFCVKSMKKNENNSLLMYYSPPHPIIKNHFWKICTPYKPYQLLNEIWCILLAGYNNYSFLSVTELIEPYKTLIESNKTLIESNTTLIESNKTLRKMPKKLNYRNR